MIQSFPHDAQSEKPGTAPDLAVVIINYRSGEHLRKCLRASESASAAICTEVVVVDNASRDGSLEGLGREFPDVSLIRNPVNSGYARACNKGMAATTAPFVCFLNPDTVPSPGSLDTMLKKMAIRPSAGAIGPRIRNPDGTIYPSCRVTPSLGTALGHAFLGAIWPGNRFTRAYKLLDWDHLSERQVDWVSGAAMLLRRKAFMQIGGFDEGFFMYVEDVDLCDRLRQAGWAIVYEPQAEMTHRRAGSSSRTPYRMIRHHHFSLIRYAWNKSKRSPRMLIFPVVVAGICLRMALCWAGRLISRGAEAPGSPAKAPQSADGQGRKAP